MYRPAAVKTRDSITGSNNRHMQINRPIIRINRPPIKWLQYSAIFIISSSLFNNNFRIYIINMKSEILIDK